MLEIQDEVGEIVEKMHNPGQIDVSLTRTNEFRDLVEINGAITAGEHQ